MKPTLLHLAAGFVTDGARHGSPSMIQRRLNQEHDVQINHDVARRILADLYGAGVVAPVNGWTHAHPVLMKRKEAQNAVTAYIANGNGLNWVDLYQCPTCRRTAPWTDGRSVKHGDDVDEYWCQSCGAEVPLAAAVKVEMIAA